MTHYPSPVGLDIKGGRGIYGLGIRGLLLHGVQVLHAGAGRPPAAQPGPGLRLHLEYYLSPTHCAIYLLHLLRSLRLGAPRRRRAPAAVPACLVRLPLGRLVNLGQVPHPGRLLGRAQLGVYLGGVALLLLGVTLLRAARLPEKLIWHHYRYRVQSLPTCSSC